MSDAPTVLDTWGKLADAVNDVCRAKSGEDFLAYGKRVTERLRPIIDAYADQKAQVATARAEQAEALVRRLRHKIVVRVSPAAAWECLLCGKFDEDRSHMKHSETCPLADPLGARLAEEQRALEGLYQLRRKAHGPKCGIAAGCSIDGCAEGSWLAAIERARGDQG